MKRDDYANLFILIVGSSLDLCPSLFTQILNGDRIIWGKETSLTSLAAISQTSARGFLWNHVIHDIKGTEAPKAVTSVVVRHVETRVLRTLKVRGVFIAIGHTPNTNSILILHYFLAIRYWILNPYSTGFVSLKYSFYCNFSLKMWIEEALLGE